MFGYPILTVIKAISEVSDEIIREVEKCFPSALAI
jgi:hypothetical protein